MFAKILLEAYENEIALDKRFKQIYESFYKKSLLGLPNFKVMKQIALRERFGYFYPTAISLIQIVIPFYILGKILYALILSIGKVSKVLTDELIIIPSTAENILLIEDVIKKPSQIIQVSIKALAPYHSSKDIINSFKDIFNLYRYLFSEKCSNERKDLILNSYDSIEFLLLIRFITANKHHTYVTDDHYQRWAYIISHLAKDSFIVQHGFLDGQIQFPHRFGPVGCIFVRDESFVNFFASYYKFERFEKFERLLSLKRINGIDSFIFLASSYPSIDKELEILEILKNKTSLPIAIKLHPHHNYNEEKKSRLLSFASYICTNSDFPICSIFISYNSYLEFAYKDAQIFTFSIERDNITILLNKLNSK